MSDPTWPLFPVSAATVKGRGHFSFVHLSGLICSWHVWEKVLFVCPFDQSFLFLACMGKGSFVCMLVCFLFELQMTSDSTHGEFFFWYHPPTAYPLDSTLWQKATILVLKSNIKRHFILLCLPKLALSHNIQPPVNWSYVYIRIRSSQYYLPFLSSISSGVHCKKMNGGPDLMSRPNGNRTIATIQYDSVQGTGL